MTSRRRRVLGGAITGSLIGALLVLTSASPAAAVEDVEIDRIAGVDRFGTAAEIALAGFPEGAATVALASGRAYPDALAGAPLGLPLLLTEPGSLPQVTLDAIEELGADDVVILGGTAAVSAAVEDELEDEGLATDRIAGVDRYETAAAIAEQTGATNVADLDGLATAFIATGLNFADALAGGPLAGAGDGEGGTHPILLTNAGVPTATEDALEELGIEQVVILGGTAAVSNAVESELEEITGNPAVRLAGVNRYATAVAVAEAAFDDFGFPGTEILLANGIVFADALAGGPLGALREAPIVLTEPTQLNADSEAFFEDHADTIETITALGGTAAVSQTTLEAAETAAETPPEARVNETIAVTPTESASQGNGSSREYTATGLGSTAVDIVIVPCSVVSVGSDGKTRFANTNTNNVADRTAEETDGDTPDLAQTASAITSVNGFPRPANDPTVTNNDYVANESPSDGTVTFTVSGPSGSSTQSSCVVPVVFVDANQDNKLNVGPAAANPAEPSEDFGTGGAVTFSPGAAGSGPIGSAGTGVDVDTTNKANNSFVGCRIVTNSPTEIVDTEEGCATYRYDDNDVFQIAGETKTLAEFEAAISPDDDVRGTYADDPAGKSTFNLFDEGPTAPTSPEVTATSNKGATVEFTESSTPTTDSYRLYRRATPSGDCPAYPSGYVFAGGVADPSDGQYNPLIPVAITDTGALAATRYCYRVVAVDDGDESPASAAVTTTTTAGPPTGAPVIVANGARGADSNGVLSPGDVHSLQFNEAMHPDTAVSGSYTVMGTLLDGEIVCGDNAVCGLSSNRQTLRVRILEPITLADYDLTITALTGMKDAGGTAASLVGSADVTIEDDSLTGDTTGPQIDQATLTDANADNNYGSVGDKLTLSFDEAVSHLLDPTGVTQAQLRAITGRSNITYGGDTVVTLTVVSGDLVFTVTGANFTSGINTTAPIPGTDNPYVADASGNPQRPNGTPATLASDS